MSLPFSPVFEGRFVKTGTVDSTKRLGYTDGDNGEATNAKS